MREQCQKWLLEYVRDHHFPPSEEEVWDAAYHAGAEAQREQDAVLAKSMIGARPREIAEAIRSAPIEGDSHE